jgi:hypothetical protein
VADLVGRDEARRFQGSRLVSTASRKTVAHRLGVSRQRVDQHVRGEVEALSYSQLEKLAVCDLRNALAVVNGARVVCESAALRTHSIPDLLLGLAPALDTETKHDGDEDCAQQKLAVIVGTVCMMQDQLHLPLRHQLRARLKDWIDCKLADIDASTAAVARAKALYDRLGGE